MGSWLSINNQNLRFVMFTLWLEGLLSEGFIPFSRVYAMWALNLNFIRGQFCHFCGVEEGSMVTLHHNSISDKYLTNFPCRGLVAMPPA
jgi:hypothetical protein